MRAYHYWKFQAAWGFLEKEEPEMGRIPRHPPEHNDGGILVHQTLAVCNRTQNNWTCGDHLSKLCSNVDSVFKSTNNLFPFSILDPSIHKLIKWRFQQYQQQDCNVRNAAIARGVTVLHRQKTYADQLLTYDIYLYDIKKNGKKIK